MEEQLMSGFEGLTVVISGGSSGIGAAAADAFAARGANVAVLDLNASEQHWSHKCDVADDNQVRLAVAATKAHFGGIDILVNNASAISLTDTEHTPMKRYDLMNGINARGTYLCTQACLPELKKAAAAGRNAHVLNMSPPLSMKQHWFAPHTAYTMAKYGMSMCTLGHSGEFAKYGIAVNSLWPRTAIATAALQMIPGVDTALCRKPDILADAAYHILTGDARDPKNSGNFHIDDELLARHGITDLGRYAVTPGNTKFIPDFFVD
jgi:citronellol/citronellal dehydrogenase